MTHSATMSNNQFECPNFPIWWCCVECSQSLFFWKSTRYLSTSPSKCPSECCRSFCLEFATSERFLVAFTYGDQRLHLCFSFECRFWFYSFDEPKAVWAQSTYKKQYGELSWCYNKVQDECHNLVTWAIHHVTHIVFSYFKISPSGMMIETK